ncbi:hypothetical protein GCM10012275_52760 [Longimycelium tulufanense]|uniref:DUF3168 domain-containing protein n=1 Tax=Longimycelium tulufanense TaxID=907463 RepID=A0A8J3FYF3_9PSEU|nr:DUF3168 domain-containing protein [Longimycelium tulufanense]GGM75513.1 hypothetical protein GCM10012275_52760 [Longimycelium tulufanense]
MIELASWPDVEAALIALLDPIATTYETTPAQLTLPLIHVQAAAGIDDYITDQPRVEVTVYASTRAQARTLAEQARQTILAAPGTAPGGVLIDSAVTEVSPTRIPYDDPDVRRFRAVYRLGVRR